MRRSIDLLRSPGWVVCTNDLGEYALLPAGDRDALWRGCLSSDHPKYLDLESRGFLDAVEPSGGLARAARRTRKAFAMEGPSLHIFVVTLRCDHACQYCQVSRAAPDARGMDMAPEDALDALQRVFESNAPVLTVEFQGGEPALRFDLVELIVEEAKARAEREGRDIRFTMATTLHHLDDGKLAFCRAHGIHLSTSVDGPEWLHDRQRRLPTSNAWSRTVAAIDRARRIVGADAVTALPTITRAALASPEEIVDTYVSLGIPSLFLRPLAPYGFARKGRRDLGYSTAEFVAFYERSLDYMLHLNAGGVAVRETMASMLLQHILTPFHSGYVDLRSPAGAGLGVLVYNYDGNVYPTDEARMAARVGDKRFCLGTVATPMDLLLSSEPMRWLAKGALAETHPDCAACAFVPYCGADPVYHAINQGEPDAPRRGTDFCDRQLAIFDLLFAKIREGDPATVQTLTSWAFGLDRARCADAQIEQ